MELIECADICPWCGEENVILVDPSGGGRQQYVEDCQVCCRPWQVTVTLPPDGEAVVNVEQA